MLETWVQTGEVVKIIVGIRSNITAGDLNVSLEGVQFIVDSTNIEGEIYTVHDNHIHLKLRDEDGPDSNSCA